MNQFERLRTLKRIRKFSRLLDASIGLPFVKFKIGLDPILGLIPGLGDAVTTLFSAYIIVMAARFGLPWRVIRQMAFNVGLEFVVGTIPLIGDIFDAFYKSNIRNLDLLEHHLQQTEPDLETSDPQHLSSVEKILAS
jgi:hypothetical protein